MAHSSTEIYLHVIFSTKGREPLIRPAIEPRLYKYFGGILAKRSVIIMRLNGTENHVHILFKYHPAVALSTIMKELKAYSTGWLKKEGYTDFAWQEGYGAFSCSKSHLPVLYNYIDNQKEHHKRLTFEEEVQSFESKWKMAWTLD